MSSLVTPTPALQATDAPLLPNEAPLAALVAQAPPRLLIVDDQAVNVQALYQAFAPDHQVLMATNGVQALELCLRKQPDLILLDVVMPGIDGHEVCRRLKADSLTRDIPVIFVTAHSDEAAETLGLELGAVDFISKPINPAIVRARVKTHLTLKRQADQLRSWVYIDGLTGACNRRHLDERVAAEWARAAREGQPLSLVMADIDHFKRYNDHYGHQAGDQTLRRVAAGMHGVLKRASDLLARYGGEEFVCLLPSTDEAGALKVAGALCEAIADLRLPHAASSTDAWVTISAGAATLRPVGGGAPAVLLSAADEQLYRAKSGGRNQACAAAPSDRS